MSVYKKGPLSIKPFINLADVRSFVRIIRIKRRRGFKPRRRSRVFPILNKHQLSMIFNEKTFQQPFSHFYVLHLRLKINNSPNAALKTVK